MKYVYYQLVVFNLEDMVVLSRGSSIWTMGKGKLVDARILINYFVS